MKRREWLLLGGILLAWWLGMALWQIAEAPPLWFDEGWTLAVARNWVEQGVYARLLDGQPIAATGMTRAITVTAPAAAGYALLGRDAAAARLPGTLFMVFGVACYFLFAHRLAGRAAAWMTLFVLLALPANTTLDSFFVGRQISAETQTLAFLLAGYLCVWPALEGRLSWIIPAALLWGLALDAKPHTLPFWMVAVTAPLALALWKKDTLQARRWGVITLGALAVYAALAGLTAWLEAGLPRHGSPMVGLLRVTAFVPEWPARQFAAVFLLVFGLPTLLGMFYAVSKLWKTLRQPTTIGAADTLQLSFIVLGASWTAWYCLLSVGWGRYYYPPAFLSALPLALLLLHLLGPRQVNEKAPHWLGRLLLGLVMVVHGVAFHVVGFGIQVENAHNGGEQVAAWMEANTPTTARFESFDAELNFLVNRRMLFPPDQVQVTLNRRTFLNEDIPIDYDPLVAGPDYIIVGAYSEMWELYQAVITSSQVQLVAEFPGYTIYLLR